MLVVAAGLPAVAVDDGEGHLAVAAGDPLGGGRHGLLAGDRRRQRREHTEPSGGPVLARRDGGGARLGSAEPQCVGVAAGLQVERHGRRDPPPGLSVREPPGLDLLAGGARHDERDRRARGPLEQAGSGTSPSPPGGPLTAESSARRAADEGEDEGAAEDDDKRREAAPELRPRRPRSRRAAPTPQPLRARRAAPRRLPRRPGGACASAGAPLIRRWSGAPPRRHPTARGHAARSTPAPAGGRTFPPASPGLHTA